MAPLSEMYGRITINNVCNVLFLIFTILYALSQNVGMLMAFRFLAGFADVATITCGSGTIADLMPREKRGGCRGSLVSGPPSRADHWAHGGRLPY
jgi:MFS family permease